MSGAGRSGPARFALLLGAALDRRAPLLARADLTALRLFDGAGDGLPGVSLERYGPGATLNVADDAGLSEAGITDCAEIALAGLRALGVEAVYVKAFARDRSRLGGRLPAEATSPTPRAGTPLPEAIVVHEYASRFEVRLYDGLSTGLFLEHRDHRRVLADGPPGRALNLFAYTCAFSVPLVAAGWTVTNVDVSARYLEWGKRNLALNDGEVERVRFLRRDALTALAQLVKRRDERYDLVILDPPSFGAADPRRGIAAWRAVRDYPALVRAAAAVLTPGGAIFAASNTRELTARGALSAIVREALGRSPRVRPLPAWPADLTDRGRVAALCVEP